MLKMDERKKVVHYFVQKDEQSTMINYNTQPTYLLLSEYVKDVIQNYTKDPNYECKILGPINAKNTKGTLIQIDVEKTAYGKMRLWQWITVQDERAYILTGACKSDDFTKRAATFKNLIASFALTEDPLELLNSEKKQTLLKAINNVVKQAKHSKSENVLNDPTFQKEVWDPFKMFLIDQFTEEGFLFQLAVLDSAKKQMQAP